MMKTNRIRRVAILLALLCCVVGLAGCHGSSDTTAFEAPETWDASKSYKLTFWAKNDTNKTQTKIYEKAIADFETLYPNIDVTMKLYTDYGKIYNDVITNIATNTTPNVCITYPDHIATYLTGENVVVPLDDLMANERYGLGGSELAFDGPTQDEIVPEFLQECVLANSHYALPYMRSTEVCYINKTFVEKLGYKLPDVLTWDFIWEVSEAATKKNADGTYAVNGQQVMIPFIYKSTDNMMIQMLRQCGGGYSRPTHRPEHSPRSRSAAIRQTSLTLGSASLPSTRRPAPPGWARMHRSSISPKTSSCNLRQPCAWCLSTIPRNQR